MLLNGNPYRLAFLAASNPYNFPNSSPCTSLTTVPPSILSVCFEKDMVQTVVALESKNISVVTHDMQRPANLLGVASGHDGRQGNT